jgi:hypothetical protein
MGGKVPGGPAIIFIAGFFGSPPWDTNSGGSLVPINTIFFWEVKVYYEFLKALLGTNRIHHLKS